MSATASWRTIRSSRAKENSRASEAQAAAMAEIKSLRYDKVEYFLAQRHGREDDHASDQARA